MALIKCENVKLSYENRVVLEGLDFEVQSGDFLCIIGENGSGKSTLVKALLSLKSVDGGSITFGDGLKKTEIGYLPQQDGARKDFPASVGEVVLSGRLNKRGLRPFYSSEDKKAARSSMEQLGIWELRKKCFRELSGGQMQRVLLSRALLATSRLILLDEPVSGLDPVVTNEFYKLISELNKNGLTVIMVTHDISASLKYASHVLHLHSEKPFFGTKHDYSKCECCKEFIGGEEKCCH